MRLVNTMQEQLFPAPRPKRIPRKTGLRLIKEYRSNVFPTHPAWLDAHNLRPERTT